MCDRGPEHANGRWGASQSKCIFCHSLSEVRQTPVHFTKHYQESKADRFIGQKFNVTQENKFYRYFNKTPEWEIPPWANAYHWQNKQLNYDWKPDLSWDFGLSCEQEAMARAGLENEIDVKFFHRLGQRRLQMETAYGPKA